MKTISLIKYVPIFLCSAALLIGACADKDKQPQDVEDQISKCLMAKDHKYEELLTKADISKHVSIDEASYKRDISSTKGPYGSCSYEWLSDRPDLAIEISGQIIKGPDKNRVKITQLDFYTDSDLNLYNQPSALALFDQGYKKLSQQEYNELLENLKKEFANKPDQLEQAKGFLDQRMKFTYEAVSQLGDRAYWKWHDTYGIELVVLTGVAQFRIETKVSSEANSSLDAAVKFAKEVLAKCKKS